jgi:predicted acylesterase/phospholipase RssA
MGHRGTQARAASLRGDRTRAVLALLGLVLLAGCGSLLRDQPPPAESLAELRVVGLPNARFFPDGPPGPLIAEAQQAVARGGARPGERHFLALSGGGDAGAFGAGLLVGWTARGDRPRFDVVTGISAGALIAPFAFLGPDYDPQLTEVFTPARAADIVQVRRVLSVLLLSPWIADSAPLFSLIERHADERMLEAIAAEYRRGRLLLIGTTNLDQMRPVIWNIGAIADSGHPAALQLFRRILLASAAIPGAFPPVMLDVDLDGRRYQEMHVDGGATTQVFLYPPSVNVAGPRMRRVVHVVRNGAMEPEVPEETARGLIQIARRSAQSLLHASGVGDIQRIHLLAQRDGVEFRLARIAPGFQAERPEPFAPVYMRTLFEHGREQGLRGDQWQSAPPGSEAAPPPAAVSPAARPGRGRVAAPG